VIDPSLFLPPALRRAVDTTSLLVASGRRALRLQGAARSAVVHITARQVLFTGVEAIPLIALLGGVVGVLVVLQSASRLPSVGQAEFMGKLLVLFVLRELGPVLVAFVVAARSGTAIATELGLLRVRGEIDGLLGVGVDPLVFVVWPRVVGVATAVVSLTVVFNVVAFVAGFGVAAATRPTLSFLALFETLLQAMTLADLGMSLLKSTLMGVAIAGVCAQHGLDVQGASTEVPVASLRAVVSAVTTCIAIEIVLTLLSTDLRSLTS
jgi:phospholipid/cholesterol/gamma-HCH transport system permease protein